MLLFIFIARYFSVNKIFLSIYDCRIAVKNRSKMLILKTTEHRNWLEAECVISYLTLNRFMKANCIDFWVISKKGSSIKDVRSQGEGVCPVRTFFGQGGREFLQMRTSALFGAKNSRFLEIYGVSARIGRRVGVRCGHFTDKGERVNFLRFCADAFYGRSQRLFLCHKLPSPNLIYWCFLATNYSMCNCLSILIAISSQ